jgi:hypothetical protein
LYAPVIGGSLLQYGHRGIAPRLRGLIQSRLIEWGEWWRLVYYGCGHEARFARSAHRLFDEEAAERVMITDYNTCVMCHPPKRLQAGLRLVRAASFVLRRHRARP